jgi:hypothetical protein
LRKIRRKGRSGGPCAAPTALDHLRAAIAINMTLLWS